MKKSAFTLIELLVVIVIIGILSTIGVAQFNTYQEKARFDKALAFAAQAEKILLANVTANEKQAVAIYKFDGDTGTNITDSSGYKQSLIMNPAYHSFSTATPDGNGQALNTNNQAITANLTKKNWNNQLTFMSWIYWNSDNGGAVPLSIYDGLATSNFYITADNRIEFLYASQTESQVYSSPNKFQTEKWHHVLGTFDGQQTRLYLDGNIISTRTATAPLAAHQADVSITLGYTPGSAGFDGMLDNIYIFDSALPNDL
jgi:prepilin-type N-terminal cleavage/methylation domain-containing protein